MRCPPLLLVHRCEAHPLPIELTFESVLCEMGSPATNKGRRKPVGVESRGSSSEEASARPLLTGVVSTPPSFQTWSRMKWTAVFAHTKTCCMRRIEPEEQWCLSCVLSLFRPHASGLEPIPRFARRRQQQHRPPGHIVCIAHHQTGGGGN